MAMIRVLITGVSGVGKTAVARALRGLSFCAIDMDEPGWASVDELGHQRWNVARLQASIDDPRSDPLFVSGCSEDQVRLYPHFSTIILLSAPKAVIVQRLASRPENPYGKRTGEFAEVMKHLEEIEPTLRERADHEIDTAQPLDVVVKEILDTSISWRAPSQS